MFSFLYPSEAPDEALKRFAAAVVSQDAETMRQMIHPDVVEGKELSRKETESFVGRFKGIVEGVREARVLQRLKSEDGKTERFEGLVIFGVSAPPEGYEGPMTLEMTLLFVLEDKKWWFERPLSLHYTVISSAPYPTKDQEDIATRFEASLNALNKLVAEGGPPASPTPTESSESAAAEYKELNALYSSERGKKGVDVASRGVDILLKGAAKPYGGLLSVFHGDFKATPQDMRPATPFDAFKDYARAAMGRAKASEARGDGRKAENIYRGVYSLGGQFLAEPGGLRFFTWGTTFQQVSANELARTLKTSAPQEAKRFEESARLNSRKLELVKTAMTSLEDMADYHSLKAAIIAANRIGDVNFRPWGVNTLVLYALKGAPAKSEAMRKVKCLMLVRNAKMQELAARELDALAAEPSGKVRSFVDQQKAKARADRIYVGLGGFK